MIIEHTTLESVMVPVKTSGDPRGTPPQFSITTTDVTDPGAWVNGSWLGEWSEQSGRVMAISPQVGAAGSLVTVEGETHQLWIKWSVAGDEPIKKCGTITAH